ncbi:MAG: GNAT family N-acetyltransferase [Candidatus Binatia bacterium]|nr:GNAT family N-acetyltransferase [Candidatus Binatia bacterium]
MPSAEKAPDDLKIVVADSAQRRAQAAAIRVAVFVEEQGIPLSAEFDLEDFVAVHVLALRKDEPVGTARALLRGETARLGRIAVLPVHRGRGVGAALVDFLCNHCVAHSVRRVIVHAQLRALPFYQRLGFMITSSVFAEDGIAHCRMERTL